MSLPTSSFEGLAATYQRHRPDYPSEVLAGLAQLPSTSVPACAVDVGAGTGISTRALAGVLPRDWRVLGLEPGRDMLAAAREMTPEENGRVGFEQAGAENLPLKDQSAGLVLTAQALHWFDRPRFYAECGRVLAPGGVLAILYNDRKADDALTLAFEARMEAEIPDYDRAYRAHDYRPELAALDWAERWDEVLHDWTWHLTPAAFSGLMLSRSKVLPWTERAGEGVVDRAFQDLAIRFAKPDGRVPLAYRTRLLYAVRGGT